MLLRRPEEGPAVVTNAAEARALAAEIRDRANRLGTMPGLLDGALEEIRGSIERVLREYDKLTRRRQGPFERDLDAVARRAQELKDAGRLSPKHLRLVHQALQHARRVHFWNAHRVIAKIDKTLEPARAWQRNLDEYRAFHRRAVQRARTAEETLAKLRDVPKPAVSPEEVAQFQSLVEACNRAADEAWSGQTHRPVAEATGDLVAHPDVDGLGLLATQENACLRDLSDLLESQDVLRDGIGQRRLADLVGTSEYSVGKWDRVFPQAAHERRKLQDLFHHLRPVVSGSHGSAFGTDLAVPVLQRRVAAWRRFPGAEGMAAWGDLETLLASGRIPTIQESARTYNRFGEAAKRAWDGRLSEEIEEQEKELVAARKALAALPSPDSLAG